MWDLRTLQSPSMGREFKMNTPGLSIKWNRHNPNLLATSHDREVFVWDVRKARAPLTFITAHSSKIMSIDFGYQKENELLTASFDQTVKFWDTSNPKKYTSILLLSSPVTSAKFNASTNFQKGNYFLYSLLPFS